MYKPSRRRHSYNFAGRLDARCSAGKARKFRPSAPLWEEQGAAPPFTRRGAERCHARRGQGRQDCCVAGFAQDGGTRGKAAAPTFWNPCSVLAARNEPRAARIRPSRRSDLDAETKKRRTAIRTVREWAIAVLQEAGAIRECAYHGWMQDRADPNAREQAFQIARRDPPPGLSPEAAASSIRQRPRLTTPVSRTTGTS